MHFIVQGVMEGMGIHAADTERFDDFVRSERYFTATLFPLFLFHNNMGGLDRFIKLIDEKGTTERTSSGDRQNVMAAPKYGDLQDAEVITEFHIARDLKYKGCSLTVGAEPAEEGELEKRSAPDVVIVVGQELIVCEGKFFNGFNSKDLNEQLRAQRRQVHYLFGTKQSLRAYRHVAILPSAPTTDIDADVVITWDDILTLAEQVMGRDHYVALRLRKAIKRYEESESPAQGTPNWDGILEFSEMRKMCQELGDKIRVGHAGNLLNMSLVEAEKKIWKWRNDPPTNSGNFTPGNWLPGTRWLEIVESTHGFGNTV